MVMIQSKELKVAIKAVLAAEKSILKNFNNIEWTKQKKDNTPVTNADPEAEHIIKKILKKEFPAYHIIGEELGSEKHSEFMWTIDPIDGTNNFVKGIPIFGCQVALLHNDEPILSVIRIPFFKKTYYAIKGKGAYCNGKRIHISNIDPKDATVVIGPGALIKKRTDIVQKIAPHVYKIRSFGAGSYEYCLTAEGCMDGMISKRGTVWDYAPGDILLKEAGADFKEVKGIALFGSKRLVKHMEKYLK